MHIIEKNFPMSKLNSGIPIITSSFNQDNIYLSINNPILFIDTCNKLILQKFELLYGNTTVSFTPTCHESPYNVYNYEQLLDSLEINNSITVYSNDTETLLYAYLLATKLNLPLIKFPSESQVKKFHPIHNITSKDQAIQLYISEVKNSGKEIEKIVVANINSQNSFLAARLAASIDAFPIFVNISEPKYTKNITEANNMNKVFEIREKIIRSVDDLSEKGFFYKSINFLLDNKLPKVIIIGQEIPYFEFPETIDKLSLTCYAGFCDDYILTDSPYCNFNESLTNVTEELLLQHGICSRIIGSPEEISFQTELFRKNRTIPKEMLIINDYSDLPILSWLSFSNMALGYKTYVELAKQNVNVTRMVERRAPYEEINTSTIIKIVKELMNETKDLDEDDQFSKILTALNFLKSVIKEVTYMYEYDWYNGLKRFKESGFSDFSIELFPNINESKINDYKTIIYIANYSRNNWYLNNKSYNFSELNNSIYFVYNLHANSVNTTSNSLIRNGNIVVSSLSSNVVPGYNAFAAKILLKNTSYYIGYSSTYAKNYFLGLHYFLKSEGKIFENPPMNPYYKLSASLELNTLPSLSFVERPIIQKENLPEIKYSDIIILNGSYQVNCRFFEYMNRTLILCSEDYIRLEGFPEIPIFYKTIELPINSDVKSVEIIPEYEHVENVYIPLIGNESNFTKFPSNFVFSKNYKSFSNKTIIEIIYSPIIYYKNNSADILNGIKYEIKYDVPFEILSFKIFNKDNVTGLLKLYSNKKQKLKTLILIKNSNTNKTIEDFLDVSKGINYKKVYLRDLDNGMYNITVLLYNNNSLVRKNFEVIVS
ncbi:MAG: hypothetical protein J7K83_04115, partial [Candidatus Aenigmarchaeota archaeon]|nr:hypothetical protein [Candidatus Aenigmarchaeota archaeon]